MREKLMNNSIIDRRIRQRSSLQAYCRQVW